MIATSAKPSWLQERFPELVGLMVAGGFALTLGELFLMGHTEKTQLIGIGMSGVGLLLAVAGAVTAPRFRKVLVGLWIGVAASGLFGAYEHVEEAQEHREKAVLEAQAIAAAGGDVDDHEKGESHGPPPMAPLSVTGLAMLGGLGLLARKA
ncbi:hypothetical protein D3C87_1097970 [compost metagenome]